MKSFAASAAHLAGIKGLTPAYLILGATWRCNARCITCFNHLKLNEPGAEELTVDEHRRISLGMDPLMWLLFTGGEPVLRKELPEIAEVYYRNAGARRITIQTNGLLPGGTVRTVENILDRCPKAGVAVSLGIDGTANIHDRMKGIDGAFDKLMDTYRRLADLKTRRDKLSINLNTVLANLNFSDMEELMSFVLKNMPSADFHGFELLRGNAPDPNIQPPSPDDYEQLLGKLETYWSHFPFYSGPFRRLIKAAKMKARRMELDVMRGGKFTCRAGTVAGYISPEGKVHFCEELDECVGDLRQYDYNLKSVWAGKKAVVLRKRIKAERCSCTHSCFVGSSILFNLKYYPDLARRAIFNHIH